MDPVSGEASLLSLLGLDAEQDSVYRLLVDRPDSEPATLAHPTAAPETVLRALTGLVESGLASAERDGDTVRYRAASPVLALAPLLESRRTALHRVEHFVTELSERHRAAHARTSGAPVEVLSGAAAIRRRLVTMQREARHEVRSMVPAMRAAAVITFEDNFDEAERDSMRRGLTLRSVVARSWLEDPNATNWLARLAADGQRIVVIDDVPIKLIIMDGECALLPLDPERDETEDPVALVVHRSGLLTALMSLFEQYFEKGWRVSTASGEESPADDAGRLDPVDRQIVALLHVGLTDSAIARQLGMGHRTVQRRLHALMEAVGAATRFQLGWHAARSGWLDDGTTRPPTASPDRVTHALTGPHVTAQAALLRLGGFAPQPIPCKRNL
ncbi:helix-turn-helix transcriptional regulator [Streptomyces sp. NPDC046712]|uniref:helix-turn-helix transcriptional regulator n=1 Tax=Streptomyces sp. NPDC046712 TaxID=3154802 RepID=UPI0033CA3B0A